MAASFQACKHQARAKLRRTYEDEVQAELTKNYGQIANAMFKINGTST
jgi:hypothetical protein